MHGNDISSGAHFGKKAHCHMPLTCAAQHSTGAKAYMNSRWQQSVTGKNA